MVTFLTQLLMIQSVSSGAVSNFVFRRHLFQENYSLTIRNRDETVHRYHLIGNVTTISYTLCWVRSIAASSVIMMSDYK